MHEELISYRAQPTNLNLSRLYRASRPWLYSQAGHITSRYRDLTLGNDGDDLVNEGMLSMTNAVRRFMWQCPLCRIPFVRRAKLLDHAREVHRLRGEPRKLVPLFVFARWSARLAMQRTATRILMRDVPYGPDVPMMSVAGEADALGQLVHEALMDLSERGTRELIRMIDGENVDPIVRVEVERRFAQLS